MTHIPSLALTSPGSSQAVAAIMKDKSRKEPHDIIPTPDTQAPLDDARTISAGGVLPTAVPDTPHVVELKVDSFNPGPKAATP